MVYKTGCYSVHIWISIIDKPIDYLKLQFIISGHLTLGAICITGGSKR